MLRRLPLRSVPSGPVNTFVVRDLVLLRRAVSIVRSGVLRIYSLWNPPCCGSRRWRQCCGRCSESTPPLLWRWRVHLPEPIDTESDVEADCEWNTADVEAPTGEAEHNQPEPLQAVR